MLGSPEVTPYDLRFRLLGIPVRVHPLFWLIMLLISGEDKNLAAGAVFILCAFVSILVHEFGHGLSARLVGDEPSEIVLYSMGGYCAFHKSHASRWDKIFVLICGPGAGFVLLGAVLAWGFFDSGINPWNALAIVDLGNGDAVDAIVRLPHSLPLRHAFCALLSINLWWGILNLFPLWPLDGGQILATVLKMFSARNGMRYAHVVGLLTAGCLAVWFGMEHRYFMAIWFGFFAYINHQMLQSIHYAYRSTDEGEWWRN